MDYQKRWEINKTIGQGGQGTVYAVTDKTQYDISTLEKELYDTVRRMNDLVIDPASIKPQANALINHIKNLTEAKYGNKFYALKILNDTDAAVNIETAKERLKNEIRIMQKLDHPNLIKIIDSDPDYNWFVSKYYPEMTLNHKIGLFKGNPLQALKEVRSIINAVAQIHSDGFVHRDIKPDNIFLENGSLILGDFGLAFNPDNSRLTMTNENVGAWDWMPVWAQSMRQENVTPAFDVFSLGKLIWAMISGELFLKLWYYNRPTYNLEGLFPDNPAMRLVNELFSKTIVEDEEDCLKDANELLAAVDDLIVKIEKNVPELDKVIDRKCIVCQTGTYQLRVDRDPTDLHNFGLSAVGGNAFRIFACDNCGHTQFFNFSNGNILPGWKS